MYYGKMIDVNEEKRYFNEPILNILVNLCQVSDEAKGQSS